MITQAANQVASSDLFLPLDLTVIPVGPDDVVLEDIY
jgi:hypothetical protein